MAFADTPISSLPPAENRSRFRDLVRSLRHRNFQLFFSGQMISLIGTWMQNIAQAWLVYRLTGSSLLLGMVGFAGQIPSSFSRLSAAWQRTAGTAIAWSSARKQPR